MSRDLTCNETMPALDDGDSITDVRRMVPSRIINQQPFTASINLIGNNRTSTNIANSANMTVRDVVSNRIRNRGSNEPVFSNLNTTTITQTPASTSVSAPYLIKTTGVEISENVSANNVLQSIFHETTQPVIINQSAGKYVNTHNNYSNNVTNSQQSQQQQRIQQQQYFVSTTSGILFSNKYSTSSTSSSTASSIRPPHATSNSDTNLATQKVGIYDTNNSGGGGGNSKNGVQLLTTQSPINAGNHAIVNRAYSNDNGNSTAAGGGATIKPYGAAPPSVHSAVSQQISAAGGGFAHYVLPPTSSVVDASSTSGSAFGAVVHSTADNIITAQQRISDSPSKYLNRQAFTAALPSPVLFSGGAAGTSHYVQQVHPPSSRSTIYASDVAPTSAGAVSARAAGNGNFVITPSSSVSVVAAASGGVGAPLGLSRGASPYAVVMPRSESVLQGSISRESPNGLSNHGTSTTPNSSQIPPNSHSSPRPSILRGNSTVRRLVERDATPVSTSAGGFTPVNFASMDGASTSVVSGNYYANNPTSSSSTSQEGIVGGEPRSGPTSFGTLNSQDGNSNSQDDSPRKRQRKQQFDSSQLQADKLMMEVHTDPHQIPPENSNLWKAGGTLLPFTFGKSGYSLTDFGGGLGAREPRRRGRPRSVNRSSAEILHQQQQQQQQQLVGTSSQAIPSHFSVVNASGGGAGDGACRVPMNPTTHNTNPVAMIGGGVAASSAGGISSGTAAYSTIVTAKPMSAYSTLSNNSSNNSSNNGSGCLPTVVAYGTAPPPSAGIVVSGGECPPGTTAPRSFMVDVDDRMLQVPLVSKRPRKYKKRTPELNPDTGEPVKKPRKKGSGRKSKKDLLLLEAAKHEIDIYGVEDRNAPTVGELLTRTTSSADGSTHYNFAELQHHIQQQQQQSSKFQPQHHLGQQPPHQHRFGMTANAGGYDANVHHPHYQQQQRAHPTACAPRVAAHDFASPVLFSSAATSSFLRLAAEEQNVVSTLCKFKLKKSEVPSSPAAAARITLDEAQNEIEKIEPDEEERLEDSSQEPDVDERKKSINNYGKDLLDAAKYYDLNGLWKTADRNLASSLAEDYDEICEFLSNLSTKTMTPKQNEAWLTRLDSSRDLGFPVFDSFDDFKNALELLKLISTTCHYFKSSKAFLDSLRSNLYASAAYRLAKSMVVDSNFPVSSINHTEMKHLKTIASLRSAERRLQDKCEDLFEFFYRELKNRMDGLISDKDHAINSTKQLLIDMDVIEAMDSVMDAVTTNNAVIGVEECDASSSRSPSQPANKQQSRPSLENDATLFSSAAGVSAALRKLPSKYRELILGSGRHAQNGRRPARRRRRTRRYCESSSDGEPHFQQSADVNDDDSDAELSDQQKAVYVFQKVRDFNDRSQKAYRFARKQALRLLERLEPSRYRDFIDAKVEEQRKRAETVGLLDATLERLREDLETAFLHEVPKHRSSFKPLDIYVATKSITMRPSKDIVNKLFEQNEGQVKIQKILRTAASYLPELRRINAPYCSSQEEQRQQQQKRMESGIVVKSAAVDRLRNVEKNYLVLDEIREMEKRSAHIIALASERVRLKFGEKQHTFNRSNFSGKNSNLAKREVELSDVDSEGILRNFADFTPSLKHRFPRNESNDVQLQFFNDRCKEVHEMAAIVVGMNHSRANILRQCFESLVEVLKTNSPNANNADGASKLGVGNGDSDTEARNAAIGSATANEYDCEPDSPVGSPHAVSDNNDSDQARDRSSDEDESESLTTMVAISGAKKRLNASLAHKNNFGGEKTKKRRWSGYHRQTFA